MNVTLATDARVSCCLSKAVYFIRVGQTILQREHFGVSHECGSEWCNKTETSTHDIICTQHLQIRTGVLCIICSNHSLLLEMTNETWKWIIHRHVVLRCGYVRAVTSMHNYRPISANKTSGKQVAQFTALFIPKGTPVFGQPCSL